MPYIVLLVILKIKSGKTLREDIYTKYNKK